MKWYKCDPARLLADTVHLDLAEMGAYVRLLNHMYVTEHPVPDDDRVLTRILHCTIEEWHRMRDTIMALMTPVEAGSITHKRVEATVKQASKQSQKKREAGRLGGLASGRSRREIGEAPAEAPRSTREQEQEQEPDRVIELHPDRPVEGVQGEELQPPPARSPHGSRLPHDWTPTEEDRSYARALSLDPDAVAEDFRDYWHARAGAGARKASWPLTWRTWCRRQAERRPARNGNGQATFDDKLRAIARGAGLDEPLERDDGRTIEGQVVARR